MQNHWFHELWLIPQLLSVPIKVAVVAISFRCIPRWNTTSFPRNFQWSRARCCISSGRGPTPTPTAMQAFENCWLHSSNWSLLQYSLWLLCRKVDELNLFGDGLSTVCWEQTCFIARMCLNILMDNNTHHLGCNERRTAIGLARQRPRGYRSLKLGSATKPWGDSAIANGQATWIWFLFLKLETSWAEGTSSGTIASTGSLLLSNDSTVQAYPFLQCPSQSNRWGHQQTVWAVGENSFRQRVWTVFLCQEGKRLVTKFAYLDQDSIVTCDPETNDQNSEQRGCDGYMMLHGYLKIFRVVLYRDAFLIFSVHP